MDTKNIKIDLKNKKIDAFGIANKLGTNDILKANGLNDFGKNDVSDVAKALNRNPLLINQIITDIGKKMVKQEIDSYSNTGYFSEVIGYFQDEVIDAGTGKQFAKPYFMDSGYWDKNQYIPTPTRLTEGKFAIAQVSFDLEKAKTGAKTDGADTINYAYQNTIQYMPGEIEQVIVSEQKLGELIARIKEITIQSFRLRKFHSIMSAITSLSYKKVINSSATDIFNATIEIASHTRKLTRGSDKYNIKDSLPAGQQPMLNVVEPANLCLIANTNYYNIVNRGVNPQLFHPDSWNKTINEFGIKIEVGEKLTVNNTFDTIITSATDGSMYLDDTTAIVIDKNAIKLNSFYNYDVNSQWINGVFTLTSSIWWTITPIWYEAGFKFICPNLIKLPNN